MAGRRKITEEAVIRELGYIAFADLETVKAAEKMKALELLGRYLGMWSDKTPNSGAEGEQSKLGELLKLLGMSGEKTDAGAVAEV